jgi:hypothetical protein
MDEWKRRDINHCDCHLMAGKIFLPREAFEHA